MEKEWQFLSPPTLASHIQSLSPATHTQSCQYSWSNPIHTERKSTWACTMGCVCDVCSRSKSLEYATMLASLFYPLSHCPLSRSFSVFLNTEHSRSRSRVIRGASPRRSLDMFRAVDFPNRLSQQQQQILVWQPPEGSPSLAEAVSAVAAVQSSPVFSFLLSPPAWSLLLTHLSAYSQRPSLSLPMMMVHSVGSLQLSRPGS